MKKIIIILVFVFIDVILCFKQPRSLLTDIHQECLLSSGVTKESLKNFFRHKKYDKNDVPIQIFVKCIFLKHNVLNENGEYSSENYVKNILLENPMNSAETIEVYKKNAENCASENGENLQEKAFRIAICIREATAY